MAKEKYLARKLKNLVVYVNPRHQEGCQLKVGQLMWQGLETPSTNIDVTASFIENWWPKVSRFTLYCFSIL